MWEVLNEKVGGGGGRGGGEEGRGEGEEGVGRRGGGKILEKLEESNGTCAR